MFSSKTFAAVFFITCFINQTICFPFPKFYHQGKKIDKISCFINNDLASDGIRQIKTESLQSTDANLTQTTDPKIDPFLCTPENLALFYDGNHLVAKIQN